MLGKLSNNLFSKYAEDDAHDITTVEVVRDSDESVEDTNTTQAPDIEQRLKMFTDEPFNLYGGSFMPSESHKQKLIRDRVYRFYEARLQEKEQTIDSMKYQVD